MHEKTRMHSMTIILFLPHEEPHFESDLDFQRIKSNVIKAAYIHTYIHRTIMSDRIDH